MRIFVELLRNELEFVHDTIGVVLVAFTEEIVAMVVYLIPLFRGTILENKTRFLEALANKVIHLAEPFLEFRVSIGIAVDIVD